MPNNADQKAKADAGKSNPLLLEKDFAAALSIVNAVLDYGAEKYERSSWRGVTLDRWDAAHRRHQKDIDLATRPKDVFDFESGLLHRAHQITGLIIMLQLELEASGKSIKQLTTFNPPPQDHKKKRKPRSDIGKTHVKNDRLLSAESIGSQPRSDDVRGTERVPCAGCRSYEECLGSCSERG